MLVGYIGIAELDFVRSLSGIQEQLTRQIQARLILLPENVDAVTALLVFDIGD